MIHRINLGLTWIFNVLLFPFSYLGDFWGILFLSILSSLLVLLIYKLVSSPKSIRKTKDQIKGHILAMRIYRDFIGVMLLSFLKSLGYTLKYLALNLIPLVVLLPALFPLMVQMDLRYGMRPFQPGEDIVVKAAFLSSFQNLKIQYQENPQLPLAMNPVFIDSYFDELKKDQVREVNYKVKALSTGTISFKLEIEGQTFEKNLIIGPHSGPLCNKKLQNSSWTSFIYPVESRLPANSYLASLSCKYPGKSVLFLGLKTHWLVYYLLLTMILVLSWRKRFGVEF